MYMELNRDLHPKCDFTLWINGGILTENKDRDRTDRQIEHLYIFREYGKMSLFKCQKRHKGFDVMLRCVEKYSQLCQLKPLVAKWALMS